MLIKFYGEDCGFCKQMAPLVEKLESELGVKVERLETWKNDENAKKLQEMDEQYNGGSCKGVPFFVNTESKKVICGATTYEHLRDWAEGK